MKKYLLLWVILILPLLSFAKNIPIPIYTNPDQTILQSTNQPTFVIRLKSNPTTGYSWFLKKYDPDYIKIVQQQYFPPEKALPGAGGIEEWKFQLTPLAFTAPHSLSIELAYARPWETKVVPKTIVFHIITHQDT